MPRQLNDHIDNPVALGARLREARQRAGLRQADISFKGCSIGYISRIESGARAPSLQVVRRLAAAVGVSEQWLASGGERPEADAEEKLRDASIALRLDRTDDAEAAFTEVERATSDPALTARAEAGRARSPSGAGRHTRRSSGSSTHSSSIPNWAIRRRPTRSAGPTDESGT